MALKKAWEEVDTEKAGALDRDGLRVVFDKIFDKPRKTDDEFIADIKSIATVGAFKNMYTLEDVRKWLVSQKEVNLHSVVMQASLNMKLLRLAQKARNHRSAAREGYAAGMSLGKSDSELMAGENIFFDPVINKQGYGYLGADDMMKLVKMKVKRQPIEWQLKRVFQDAAFRAKEAASGGADAEQPVATAGSDGDGDGAVEDTGDTITYESFIKQIFEEVDDKEKGIQRPTSLAELFHVMDYDNISEANEGDGELSATELQFFVTQGNHAGAGKELSFSDAELMLTMAGMVVSGTDNSDDDGKLMADEFVTLMGMFNGGKEPAYKAGYGPVMSEKDFQRGCKLWQQLRSVLSVLLYLNSLYDKCSHYSEEYLEQWTADVNSRCCFYNPDAPKRQAWDMAMLPLFMIIIIMVPLRIGFDYDEPPFTFWWWIDAGTDVYFLIDIVVNFRTAYHDEHGQLVTNLKLIRRAYLRSWFLIDFLSCLPIPYILLIMESMSDEKEGGGSGSQLKLAKILRLFRLAKNLARLGRLSKLKELVAQWEDYLEPIMTALQLMKLLLILLLLGHMMACVWYFVGVSDEVRDDNFLVHGWVYEERWGNRVGRWTRYIAAYVYSLTDFTYEVSHTDTEKITAVILHLMYETFFGACPWAGRTRALVHWCPPELANCLSN
eukprot:SAG22_NODE_50_length_24611_cov_74.139687_6_plen_665_part_00